MLISDPARFDGVRMIGVGEHAWRHTRRAVLLPQGDDEQHPHTHTSARPHER